MSLLLKSLFVALAIFAFMKPAIAKVGLYVPLYMYLGHYWTELIDLKNKYDDLPVLAIVNPDSGPGTYKDPDFSDGIDKLKAAGIIVHAYIPTNEGNRATADVEADIDLYKSFYPQVEGIFFDEMANDAGKETYYTTISAYARTQGFEITHGNPGTNIPKSYADTVNIIVIAETTGTSDLSESSDWTTTNPAKLALIATTESELPKKWVKEACKLVDWIFVTDDIEPNPYDTLPSYPFLCVSSHLWNVCRFLGKQHHIRDIT